MKHKQSQRFPKLEIVELWDEESDRDKKYLMLEAQCEWSDPYEESVLFYINEENWNKLAKNKNMFMWLLKQETA